MRNVQRLTRPVLASYIFAATVEIHRMVEGLAGDPVELFCGVWLLCLYTRQYIALG
jgi:hypothetical protein